MRDAVAVILTVGLAGTGLLIGELSLVALAAAAGYAVGGLTPENPATILRADDTLF